MEEQTPYTEKFSPINEFNLRTVLDVFIQNGIGLLCLFFSV